MQINHIKRNHLNVKSVDDKNNLNINNETIHWFHKSDSPGGNMITLFDLKNLPKLRIVDIRDGVANLEIFETWKDKITIANFKLDDLKELLLFITETC